MARQSAAVLRREIQEHLADRAPDALTPRLRRESERFSCGLAEMDAALCGGVAVGAITELVGEECTGRTTMALAYAAASIQRGHVAAWIDVDDVLDPEGAATSGVDLERLLWVRCGPGQEWVGTGMAGAGPIVTQGLGVRPLGTPVPPGGCGSPHPRSEGMGMPQAIQDLLLAQPRSSALPERRRNTGIGTPGAPNRPLPRRGAEREEQVATDRLPPRRGERVAHVVAGPGEARGEGRDAKGETARARGAELLGRERTHVAGLAVVAPLGRGNGNTHGVSAPDSRGKPQGIKPSPVHELYGTPSASLRAGSEGVPFTKPDSCSKPSSSPACELLHPARTAAWKRKRVWTPLDQALRATDLLLQSGGFRLLVLDLGSTPAEMAWRIPLATWFRYRAACARTQTSLLLLTRQTCAKSSAELVVRMDAGRSDAQGGVLTGVSYRAERERQRFQPAPANKVVPIRKPPQAERPGVWRGRAGWAV